MCVGEVGRLIEGRNSLALPSIITRMKMGMENSFRYVLVAWKVNIG